MPGDAKLALAVLVLEACVGYPRTLFAVIGHPVTWMGRLLEVLARWWNPPRAPAPAAANDRAAVPFSDAARRALGIVAVTIVAGLSGGAGFAIARLAAPFEYGGVLVALVATCGLAQRSLYEHVRAVEAALTSTSGLDGARSAVARIVGRDTATLSVAEVSAAAIESLAESFNDAVVAPAFWLLVGGLPGLFAYKALNTADSMIGHIEPRWRAFGWAAARLDDLANFLPARIAGALLALAGARGFRVMLRDASKHASPNAGWPEAAAAGALHLRLGGPTCYDGITHTRPHFGDGPRPQAADLDRALRLYRKGCAALWLLLAAIAFVPITL
jgi:adenosylcobinamide-phosphate synthase